MSRHKKSDKGIIVFSIVMLVVLVVLIMGSSQKQAEQEASLEQESRTYAQTRLIEMEQEEQQKAALRLQGVINPWDSLQRISLVTTNDAADFILQKASQAGLTSQIGAEEFTAWNIHCSAENTEIFRMPYAADAHGFYQFHFTIKSETGCIPIQIEILRGDTLISSSRQFVLREFQSVFCPIEADAGDTITYRILALEAGDFVLGDLGVERVEGQSITDLKSGNFNLEEENTVILTDERIDESKGTRDQVLADQYLFALCADQLMIYSVADPKNPVLLSALDGLGDNTRQIAISTEKNTVVITSRDQGAYVVDVSDPSQPFISARIDTLELATGVSIDGQYAFICSRYFGVEIYDISDNTKPVLVSVITENCEYMDCTTSDGYLFISTMGTNTVRVFDIHDIGNPKKISQLTTNGNAYGVAVSGQYLYVATGGSPSDTDKTYTDPDYGNGFGLDIFSIADITAPVWLSTAKADGRVIYSGNDVWQVDVTDGYAYLCSAYNGLYIYDVSTPGDPALAAKYTIGVYSDSGFYQHYGSSLYFPYDMDSYMQDPICSVCSDSGILYLGGVYSGLYVAENELAGRKNAAANEQVAYVCSKTTEELAVDADVFLRVEDGRTRAVTSCNGLVYVACGYKGIAVCDEQLQVIRYVACDGSVKDIASGDGYIAAALDDAGVGIMKFMDDSLTMVANISLSYAASSVQTACEGQLLIVQAGNYVTLYDLSDIESPKIIQTDGYHGLYYRSLITVADESYAGVMGLDKTEWYSFPDGMADTATRTVQSIEQSFYEANGAAIRGDELFVIHAGGYYYIDLRSDLEEKMDVIKIDNCYLNGKAIIDGQLLYVAYEPAGTLAIIDITNPEDPMLIKQIDFGEAIDIPCITDQYVYVPVDDFGVVGFEKQRLIP